MTRTDRWLFAIYVSSFFAVLGAFVAFLLWDRQQWQENPREAQPRRIRQCGIRQFPSDPIQRTDVLINQSEDMRQIGEFWRRYCFVDDRTELQKLLDLPSSSDFVWRLQKPLRRFGFTPATNHMRPERIHGGIM